MAGKGHGDGYSQNNLYSVPRSQDDMATHGRLDHDAWKGEWDGGGAQVFAPSVRPFRLPDTQFPSIPPSPSHSPSGSIGSSSDSPRAVGSEALVKFTKNRRKKPALFKCEFKNCDRDFTTKANQKREYSTSLTLWPRITTSFTDHINSHWGIKPYSCGQCGRGFSVGHARQRHLKTCIKTVFKQPSDFMQRGGVEESLYPMLQVFPLSTPSPHPASMRFSA